MHKHFVNEQTSYLSSFRIFLSHENEAKFYTRNQSIIIKDIATFDSKATMLSSIELFVASFASSYILAIKKEAKKEKIILEEIEARFICHLENPLELLGVVGYEDEATIKALNGDVYIYSEMDANPIKLLAQRALHKSIIYKMLNTQHISVHIEPKIISV
ncbi:OsmC family protein [Sulfurospirillum sp.]|uniref:OsmC family protein n=1 Tax=Sulfurospirillum sp. TaxID=2053622 RepID=UPI002FDC7F3B